MAVRRTPVRNRLRSLTLHLPRYRTRGLSRLAEDADVSKSAVSRLLRGIGEPDYLLLYRVAEALSRESGFPIDPREIAAPEGRDYPTLHPCALFGCRCLPPWAYDEGGTLRPAFRGVRPGEWTDGTPWSPKGRAGGSGAADRQPRGGEA